MKGAVGIALALGAGYLLLPSLTGLGSKGTARLVFPRTGIKGPVEISDISVEKAQAVAAGWAPVHINVKVFNRSQQRHAVTAVLLVGQATPNQAVPTGINPDNRLYPWPLTDTWEMDPAKWAEHQFRWATSPSTPLGTYDIMVVINTFPISDYDALYGDWSFSHNGLLVRGLEVV